MAKQVQILKQQMKLSPQQMMLMKMLQMPVLELEQSIMEEVEKNPLLEAEGSMDNTEPIKQDDAADEVRDIYGDDEDYGYAQRASGDVVLASDTSMVDGLLDQLAMKDVDERQMVILNQLVGSLDDAGYLGRGLDMIENELSFRYGVDCREGEMEEALAVLQSLEPAGVGARSLQECMLLQLKRIKPRTLESRCATEIVERCFDAFSKRNYDAILAQLEIDEETLKGGLDCIKRLNPKPCGGDLAAAGGATAIIPDFVVTIREGSLSCIVNQTHTPKLSVNKEYLDMMQDLTRQGKMTDAEKETVEFIRANSESAEQFIQNIQQRKSSMEKTIKMVAKLQRKFLASGDPSDLKPLTQKEVAEQVGIDETVLSRIVNQKYVQTDFGTMLLKEFFVHSTISNSEGEDVTTAAIKQHLKEMVDSEDKQSPLTDSELEAKFKELGISLARRTIAKYREQLGIPVGRLRKMIKFVVMALMLGAGSLMAQTPSYYDSLIMAQQQPARAQQKDPAKVQSKATLRQNKAKIDTALLRGDDLIDKIYDSGRQMPSALWYGNRFSSNRVRLENYTLDSLPDEVNLKLLKGDEQFCFPVKNVRTSPYGWRWERPHRGVDIALNTGDPVHCAFNGVVRIAHPMGAYGNLVVVRHYNGLETVYGHLSRIMVKPMQEVNAGDVLGLGGSTGRSTGPHLHFEVRFQYEPFDPEWILDFSNYTLRTKKLHLDKTYFGISKPRGRQTLAYKADKSFVKEEAVKVKPKPLYYTVKKGDRMADIESLYKTTAEKIKELNPEFEKLRPGLKLRVR